MELAELKNRLQELFDQNDHAGTQALLRDALAACPADRETALSLRRWLGRLSYYGGHPDEARVQFLEALRLNPRDPSALIYLARLAEEQHRPDSALRLYTAAMDARPDYAHLSDTLRRILRAQNASDPEIARLVPAVTSVDEPTPLVSIIVVCYNKVEHTERCLRAIVDHTDGVMYEVIVVDNGSVDETSALLESYAGRITFVRSEFNRGFVGGNNFAEPHARGEYVVFLNNDTEVQDHWLRELVETFRRDPLVGAAGSKLIYPDGRLQEAGGAIFSDGTGWNYGRNANPGVGLYTFAREVDYCSGAALMVRRDLFERLGGFDERYAPAYFEDTDLCFGIRKLGYRVMYCPESKVVHYEGATAGTDLGSGFKKYQVINTPKFQEKWAKELRAQSPPDPSLSYQFSNRRIGKRVLIIDDWPPLPDRAAGSLRLHHTVRQMLDLGFQVTYAHLMDAQLDTSAREHMKELRLLGVEMIWFEYKHWWDFRNSPAVRPTLERLIGSLDLPKRKFDLVYICFWHIADYFIDLIRSADPTVPVVVDSMDLHYLREARQADVTKDPAARARAQETKRRELAVYAKADAVTTVTEQDREKLRADLPKKAVLIMTDVHDPFDSAVPFEQRRDLLFVGNFNHTPNEDAVVWFCERIFPLIRARTPDVRFLIVGNNPTPRVRALASDDVEVTGWVPSVRPYLERCRVSVVPLRYGAGNKGKVGETLSHGLPMVSTNIGAEGMNIVPGEHSFVADDPAAFADAVVRLYTDAATWAKFSAAGKALIAGQYSSALMRRRIEYLTSFPDRIAFTSRRALEYPTPPEVSVIIVTYNQWKYTRQCLDSIREHTRISHEIIIVDNASTDGTLTGLRSYPEVRLIRNAVNVGFPGAVNQGINAALGRFVLLLNNDTLVTDGWLERMVEVAESSPVIGIVGPVSNSVSGVQLDRDASYDDVNAMPAYAAKKRQERQGTLIEFPRVAFLCTLIRRDVIDRIGGLDERFAPGNYEDDDFCLRAQIAGFRTVIAADVFIHHYGSRSFRAGGEQAYADRLSENRNRFVAKWGTNPDSIWLDGAGVRKRDVRCPVHRDVFIQEFERASVLLEDRDWEHAAVHLTNAVNVYHTSPRRGYAVEFPDVLDLAATVFLHLGDLEEARSLFEEELRLTPTSVRATVGLAQVFKAAGLVDAARAMLDAAIQLDPENDRWVRERDLLMAPADESVAAEEPASAGGTA